MPWGSAPYFRQLDMPVSQSHVDGTGQFCPRGQLTRCLRGPDSAVACDGESADVVRPQCQWTASIQIAAGRFVLEGIAVGPIGVSKDRRQSGFLDIGFSLKQKGLFGRIATLTRIKPAIESVAAEKLQLIVPRPPHPRPVSGPLPISMNDWHRLAQGGTGANIDPFLLRHYHQGSQPKTAGARKIGIGVRRIFLVISAIHQTTDPQLPQIADTLNLLGVQLSRR